MGGNADLTLRPMLAGGSSSITGLVKTFSFSMIKFLMWSVIRRGKRLTVLVSVVRLRCQGDCSWWQ